jgi:hypothetical protein
MSDPTIVDKLKIVIKELEKNKNWTDTQGRFEDYL